jgi:hypothetical protein
MLFIFSLTANNFILKVRIVFINISVIFFIDVLRFTQPLKIILITFQLNSKPEDSKDL